jgi:hypothetical protein
MAFVDNFQDFIKYHADAAGMTREEYMAVLMSEAKKKPGPDPYHRGLDDDEVEDKEEQIKKQAKMDDDDPDAYEEMPGDEEARKKGEVKTSDATKAYNKLYKENKHVKSMNEMAMGYDGHTGLFYIKGVPFTEERLEQVLKHLRTKVKLGDLPKQFSYFPAIQVADDVGGEIVTITLDKAKEIEATLKRFKGKLAHDGDFNESVTEKREDVGKFNTVKKVIKELGRRPSEQELATFITKNYYDVTEVERGEDDPAANDKIADLVAFYKFDIDDWSIAWVDAQNESAVTEAKGLPSHARNLSRKLKTHWLPDTDNKDIYFLADTNKGQTITIDLSVRTGEYKVIDKKDNVIYQGGDPYAAAKLIESVVNEADDKEQKSTDRSPLDDDAMETGLKKKAKESGVPIGIIRAVMRRGLAAWKSGHRPGANQQQWGYARVNAFLTKGEGTWGKADKDLAKEVRDGGHDKKLKKA